MKFCFKLFLVITSYKCRHIYVEVGQSHNNKMEMSLVYGI